MTSDPRRTALATVRHRSLGVALLLTILAAVALSVAFYRKTFTSALTVQLRTSDIGSNLTQFADVKLRGLVVGEVRGVSSTGDAATVTLAIDPAKARFIPANTSAQLLPTSLFGRTYVALVPPASPSGRIRDGDVIDQDRSSTAIDVERVLADALPVLDALHPAQLTVTLRSIADALDGRGAQLGDELVQLDGLLKQFNPKLPQLLHDVVQTGAVARDWTVIVPDLLGALDNVDVTAATVASQSAGLAGLLGAVTGAGDQLTQFVNTDGAWFIRVVASNRATLDLLARYAPEYVCTLNGLIAASSRVDRAVADHQLRAAAQLVVAPPAYTTPLQYTHGTPSCAGLPGALATQSSESSVLPQSSAIGAGSLAEARAVSALISGDLRTTPEQVSPVAALLSAPLLRGNAVIVK